MKRTVVNVALAETATESPFPEVAIPAGLLEQVRAGRFEDWPADQVLSWALDTFAPRIALSASFGSVEGMVILDMMHKLRPQAARVFTLDTGRLFQETYELMDRVRARYQIEIEVYFPQPEAVEAMVRQYGLNLFYDSVALRQKCCGVRKVEPLKRAMRDLDAWIAGLRPEQSVTRRDVRKVEIDDLHGGRIKINPLVGWSKDEVWAYVNQYNVPVNALHAQGFPTVGCLPCTRAIEPGEDERAGRWWWEHVASRECGLHVEYEEQGSGI
ncbi:MAG: phosphoadenylyl-sulfate reductase [Deltaproteobacteria bacterium]|nr:phosphoadenylyl-sulfate reductase [Deltaproteobacteria bacterium]